MKILKISKVTSFIVETNCQDWKTYRRNGPDDWENLMGESWEGIYDTNELEEAFNKYKMDCS